MADINQQSNQPYNADQSIQQQQNQHDEVVEFQSEMPEVPKDVTFEPDEQLEEEIEENFDQTK